MSLVAQIIHSQTTDSLKTFLNPGKYQLLQGLKTGYLLVAVLPCSVQECI